MLRSSAARALGMRRPSLAVYGKRARFLAVGLVLASGPARADDSSATVGSGSPRARPPDVELTSDTTAQFYDVRSPTGATVIPRRRLLQTLGASVYNLLGTDDPASPTLTFRARLRYDADYGGNPEETSPLNTGVFVPGFQRGPVDLMYGYVEGRRFLHGLLGFRLGRQYVTDALGWWAFDGGLAKITTPYYFAVEAYGGLEERGGLPLSTNRFERDGVWRGDRSGFDRNEWTAFQPNDVAPAFGAAIESAGFTWLHGRLTYRRVYNTGTSNVSEFQNGLRAPAVFDGRRISQERIGYAFDGALPNLGGVKGGLVYDIYVGEISNIFASVDWYTSPKLTLSFDYDYYRPTFDGDSIFNFFMALPMNDFGLRASWDPTDHLAVAGGVHARVFTLQNSWDLPSNEPPPSPIAPSQAQQPSTLDPMGGGNLTGRYRIGDGAVGARILADIASNGDRIGFDVYGERTLETRYIFQARTGVWQWNDQLRADRDATSFGYVLATGYRLFPRSQVLADFQHDINRVAGQRFRAMVWLTIALSN
jgi:hypothetical protein